MDEAQLDGGPAVANGIGDQFADHQFGGEVEVLQPPDPQLLGDFRPGPGNCGRVGRQVPAGDLRLPRAWVRARSRATSSSGRARSRLSPRRRRRRTPRGNCPQLRELAAIICRPSVSLLSGDRPWSFPPRRGVPSTDHTPCAHVGFEQRRVCGLVLSRRLLPDPTCCRLPRCRRSAWTVGWRRARRSRRERHCPGQGAARAVVWRSRRSLSVDSMLPTTSTAASAPTRPDGPPTRTRGYLPPYDRDLPARTSALSHTPPTA